MARGIMKYIKAGSTSIYKPLSPRNGREFIYTPSSDYNFTLPDCWTLSWVTTEEEQKREIKDKLNWTNERMIKIQNFSDEQFNENKLTWPNLFSNANHLIDYLNFIEINLDDLILCSISFPESEIEDLQKELKPKYENSGKPGIYQNILLMEEEKRSEENIYGFDIVGMEIGGSFYSSNQLGLRKWLIERYNISYNEYGLIYKIEDCYRVISEVNANRNLEDDVPWFICRIDKEFT